MRKRQIRLKGWAGMLLGMAMAAASVPVSAQLSLPTVVDLALRNSSAVKLAEADAQKAQAALAQTRDAFLPSLTFSSGLPAFPTVGFNGGVPSTWSANTQSLVFSLSQKSYVQAARSGVKAATLSLKEAREQASLDASTAYIELDAVNSELEAAHQQDALAERLTRIEQERTEAGVDPLSDLLQARLTAAQLKLKRLHLETRAGNLSEKLAVLTGLPMLSITPDHGSIPEIPAVKAEEGKSTLAGIESVRMLARSKQQMARGDALNVATPQISFGAQYSHHTSLLNNAASYYEGNIPITYFGSGFQIQLPLFDFALRAKAKESAAEALRATVEAEQAQRQNEAGIAELTSSLRELDTLAEIASLKQQIAHEQLQSVLTQLELGGESESGSGAPAQLTPKAEQLARIEERQTFQESLETGFDLAKARLNLLRALGHMEDWLAEVHAK